ncbi:MAG: helix-turn-helix transcriptional regulator [Planctomycetota bacterium]
MRTEESLADLVVELVTDRPLTGLEITRALEERYHVVLRGREGALYAALVRFVREGFLSRLTSDSDEGRQFLYSLPVLEDIEEART